MISSNIIQRTLHIRYKGSTGSSFIIDVNGKQYLITAKHVIETLVGKEIIEFNYQTNWKPVEATLVGHSPHSDVSVLSVPALINISDNVIADSNSILYGQDIYFLGFPYRLQSDIGDLNAHLPVPLVKKGIVSNFLFENPRKVLLLDGHNNPGFSGGPVIFKSYEDNSLRVAAIISGYSTEMINAQHQNKDLDIQIKTNTGIIISHGIEAAIELINANPIGLQL
jgi:S1-C subfamily serine protease